MVEIRKIEKLLALTLILVLPVGLFSQEILCKELNIPYIMLVILGLLILINKGYKKIILLMNIIIIILLQFVFFRNMQVLPSLAQFCNFVLLGVYICDKKIFNYYVDLIKDNIKLIFGINLIIVFLIIYSFFSNIGWVILWNGRQFKSFFSFPHDTCYYLIGLQSVFIVIASLTEQKFMKITSIINVYLLGGIATFTNARTPFILAVFFILLLTYRLINKRYILIYYVITIPISCLLIMTLMGYIDRELIINLPIINKFISTEQSGDVTNSRGLIWNSIKQYIKGTFNFIDYLIGNGSGISRYVNYNTFGQRLWSHNDFLEVIVSYGCFGLLLYINTLINIYRKNKNIIFLAIIIIMAIWNGFYISPQVIAFMPFILISIDNLATIRNNMTTT